jgi:hypothetical protein
MALPGSREARSFYRVAQQRLEDAQVLLGGERTTGAVYLAGYAVECALKALLLSSLAPGARQTMVASFRGAKAHDFEWLSGEYRKSGGSHFPGEIARLLNRQHLGDRVPVQNIDGRPARSGKILAIGRGIL